MRQLVVFISYSWFDGKEFAMRLRERLRRISPPIDPWVDLDHPRGHPFTSAIEDAIGGCDVLLFVMTRDSVRRDWCRDEVARARRMGKRIIPLLVHDDAELPLELERHPPVDFTSHRDEESAWRELDGALALIDSPRGTLGTLEERRRLLGQRAARASGATQQRYERDLAELDAKIQEERERVEDPQDARRQVSEAITVGKVKERAAEAASVNRSGIRSVNDPPALHPNHFHDRSSESQRLEGRLSDPSTRLVAVIGRDGVGKTAMVSRLLADLRMAPQRLPIDAFIYLSAHGSRPIRPAILLEDLRKVVPDKAAALHLVERLNDPTLTIPDKLDEVLKELAGTRVVVVIDNAEELLDADGDLRDRELDEVVTALLRRDHGVKLVLVTREAPKLLLSDFFSGAEGLEVDLGLPRADAYNFLRRLDKTDVLGLRSAPEEYLERAHELTGGYPRALEALYSILESEPETSLPQLLIDMDQLPDDQDVVHYLIRRMFDRLDPVERRVMQGLAIYCRPVLPAAVDYLLQTYLDGFQSEPTLHRLLARRLVRLDGDRFYIPASPDGEWFLDRLPWGLPADRDRDRPPLTRLALLHRAAGYFADTRKGYVQRIDDLSAQFAEIDLRMRGEEYDLALRLITQIDSQYLMGWGSSEAVARWRSQLIGKLAGRDLELHNLAWLANARRQQEDYRRAIADFGRALELAEKLGDMDNQCGIQITLATTHFEYGEASRAAKLYASALSVARRRGLEVKEAKARSGLSLCLGETGRFQKALEHHGKALAIVEKRRDNESKILEAELLLSGGWFHGQMGRTQEAVDFLRRGRAVASALDAVLDGLFLDGEAVLLIDSGHMVRAIELATEAVAIGVRTRSRHLSREASTTLALGYLCAGDLEAARGAAEAAARYRRSRRALGAYVLQGITSFRSGDKEKANVAFLDAHLQAETLREREEENFQVLDIHGLALCGLALCGDHEQLDRAISSYRRAREVTREPGVVRRSLRLLDELAGGRETQELLASARRVAAGS